MTNYNVSPDDPNFGTTLGCYMLLYRFIGAGWAIQHSRDMNIETLRKLDKIEDMLAYLLMEGQDNDAPRFIEDETDEEVYDIRP